MVYAKNAANLLKNIVNSVKGIFPFDISVNPPVFFTYPIPQQSIRAVINTTGDIRGCLIIDGDEHTFGKIGESMFGMPLEGEMLISFIGELANMIGGKFSTFTTQQGLKMDITPPTVLVRQSTVNQFEKVFHLPIIIQNMGYIIIIFNYD